LRYLASDQHPDHDTLAAFRQEHITALGELFFQALRLCQKASLVKLGNVSIDGTKIKASASTRRSVKYDRISDREGHWRAEIAQLLQQPHDRQQLVPMVKSLRGTAHDVPVTITADAGYWDTTSLLDPTMNGIEILVAPDSKPLTPDYALQPNAPQPRSISNAGATGHRGRKGPLRTATYNGGTGIWPNQRSTWNPQISFAGPFQSHLGMEAHLRHAQSPQAVSSPHGSRCRVTADENHAAYAQPQITSWRIGRYSASDRQNVAVLEASFTDLLRKQCNFIPTHSPVCHRCRAGVLADSGSALPPMPDSPIDQSCLQAKAGA
jgi:hypothetical protein